MTQEVLNPPSVADRELVLSFLKSFPFSKQGFEDVQYFTDRDVGVSFQKKTTKSSDHKSLFHLLIPNRELLESSNHRKRLLVTAVYGKEEGGGVRLRPLTISNLNEPLDLDFTSDFYFDSNEQQLYFKNRKIRPDELLRRVCKLHTKTTRLIAGLFLRSKLLFWRFLLPRLLSLIALIFHYILFAISGDRYTYTFIFKEEKLNGRIISSSNKGALRERDVLPVPNEKIKQGKELNFFGNNVPQHSIVFYSAIHLFALLWIVENTSLQLVSTEVFSNNFLTVLYVVVSFWFFDSVLPYVLKGLIRVFSTLSTKSEYKMIRA